LLVYTPKLKLPATENGWLEDVPGSFGGVDVPHLRLLSYGSLHPQFRIQVAFGREMRPLISGKSRLVKYYDLGIFGQIYIRFIYIIYIYIYFFFFAGLTRGMRVANPFTISINVCYSQSLMNHWQPWSLYKASEVTSLLVS